jgi:hypothetical protein
MRAVAAVLSVAVLCLLVVAAPVPKDKGVKEEPATAVQKKQAENNLKQILLAMHNYHDVNGTWPADTDNLSWRVQILPYLEQDKLYKKFDHSAAWDSDANKKLIEELPKVFAPVRTMNVQKGETFLRGFGGTNAQTAGIFQPGQRLTIVGVTDGTSNTIAVIDADEPVVWTKPGTDLDPDAKEFPKLGRMIDGDYFFAAMCDGSVAKVKRKFDEKAMKAAVSRCGGEIVNTDDLFAK